MNRSKIEWTDYTWNPITGCTRGCSYCYARRMAYRLKGRCGYPEDDPFRPTFHRDRLEEPYHRRKPVKIFTVSMGEFFDHEVPIEWREEVLDVISNCRHLTFQILTKRYYNLHTYDYPSNLWLGVSQDCKTTDPDAIRALWLTDARTKFVSFEPLLGPRPDVDLHGIDWVIIGAQTGPGAKPPKPEWVQAIIHEARDWNIPVFLKNNLNWPEKIQEFPEGKRK